MGECCSGALVFVDKCATDHRVDGCIIKDSPNFDTKVANLLDIRPADKDNETGGKSSH